MEHLIRFAQVHNILKKNAERAQKLAQESNAALETGAGLYARGAPRQRRPARTVGAVDVAFSPPPLFPYHLFILRVGQVESPTVEELALEQRAAEQAETLRELTSTNAALSWSARAGCHGDVGLGGAARVRSVSEREQTRRLALLKGINFVRVQTEGGNLRQQSVPVLPHSPPHIDVRIPHFLLRNIFLVFL
jgi:hypothetical protein